MMNLYASLLPLESQATMLLLTLGAHGRRVSTCSTHGFPDLCFVHASASCVPLLFLPRAHHSSWQFAHVWRFLGVGSNALPDERGLVPSRRPTRSTSLTKQRQESLARDDHMAFALNDNKSEP